MRIFRLGKIIDSIFLKKYQRKKINHILEKGADPLMSHTTYNNIFLQKCRSLPRVGNVWKSSRDSRKVVVDLQLNTGGFLTGVMNKFGSTLP